jgi:hypothetical protein
MHSATGGSVNPRVSYFEPIRNSTHKIVGLEVS